ncbi:MAG: hypothetical protein E7357_00410 [Clostridiales bacterium]|nr:hypothetical protein [Clostridiales bacterium]
MDKITVGIFWICDEGGYLDIVYDTEQYDPDWRSDFGDEFIMYEKSHEDMWKKLSAKRCQGKYKAYAYDDFPRGRVTYDADEEVYIIDYDVKLKPKMGAIKAKIMQMFNLGDTVCRADSQLTSSKGRFNK